VKIDYDEAVKTFLLFLVLIISGTNITVVWTLSLKEVIFYALTIQRGLFSLFKVIFD